MMMKFNFGCGPLILKGTTPDEVVRISITLDEPYDDIPMKVIVDMAEKLYSIFNVSYVSLYKDDVCICTIDKEKGNENENHH